MNEVKFFYVSSAGGDVKKEGEITLHDYENASNTGMSLSSYLAHKYPDADPYYGDVFTQACLNLGVHAKPNAKRGILASTVYDVMSGVQRPSGLQLASGSTVVAPSTQGTTPATRLFFPETVMRLMNEALVEDYGVEAAVWARMISETDVIQTEMFTQPQIDVTAPRDERSQPIAQNTMPRQLVSITASQYSKSIITTSIGLQISEQAQRNTALNLVSTILLQQAQGERYAKLWEDINDVVAGNTDAGQAALTAVNASTYDAAATGGVMTQTAWLKALYDPTRKVSYDSMLCDLDAFLAVQKRTDRPVIFDPRTTGGNAGDLGNYGLNVEPNVLNWAVGVPNAMVVPTGTIPADQILLFDSRYALRRVVNASAQYSAIQDLVLQRSTAMRFDAGELTYRLMDEAFKLLDFS
jgi:hypothetical protein